MGAVPVQMSASWVTGDGKLTLYLVSSHTILWLLMLDNILVSESILRHLNLIDWQFTCQLVFEVLYMYVNIHTLHLVGEKC